MCLSSVLSNLFWYLLSKISIYHLLCVLDSIHTHYASNMFQYLVSIFEQVLKKFGFHLESLILKNTGFCLSLKLFTLKIVQHVCNMC